MKNAKYFLASITFAVAAFVVVSMAGCSSSSTDTTPAAGPVTPKVGSSYIYAEHDRDSTGGQTATVTDTTITYTVVSSGDTVAGMPNTFTTVSSMGDTDVWAFDANGDLYLYWPYVDALVFTLKLQEPWLRVPTSTNATNVAIETFDTTVVLLGTSAVITTTINSGYLGTDKLTVNSSVYSGSQATVHALISASLLGTPFNATGDDTYSVDNSIGFFFHRITAVSTPAIATLAATGSKHEFWLTTYTLVK